MARVNDRTRPAACIHVAPALTALFLLPVLTTGCASSGGRERPAGVGEPLINERAYEEAVLRDPYNVEAHEALGEARAQLAANLAADAEDALAAGRIYEGYRWSQMAASIDPRWRALEREAGEIVVGEMLEEARAALDEEKYLIARQRVEDALEVLPGHDEAADLKLQIDRAEAAFLAGRAEENLDQGEWEWGFRLLDRARRLDPENEAYEARFQEFARENRIDKFNRLADRANTEIAAGRLNAAEGTVKLMESLDVNNTLVGELRSRLDDRKEMADSLRESGLAALKDEQFQEAIDDLLAASQINQDLGVEPTIRDAQFRLARSYFLLAIEEGDRLSALLAAREMDRAVDDPDIRRLIPQLERELIDHTRATATRLHTEGRTAEAVALLETVLEHVADERLRSMLARYQSPPPNAGPDG